MKKLALATLMMAALFAGMLRTNAQTATPVPTTTGPTNSSQGTLFVCSDSAILTFTGTSLVGWDIFYQIFSGASGSGTAITGLRQVPVAGVYNVTDKVSYNSGVTIAAGGQASAKVSIARETNPSRIDFSYVLTDAQDGCNVSTSSSPSGVDVGGGAAASTSGTAGVTTSILAPNGGVLNPNLKPEASIVIGARPSALFRSDTAGLIFAQCDAFALAEPGIIYDTDGVTIFWSWFTKTQAEMDQHIANAVYTVQLNTAALPMTMRTTPVQRNGNFWVFYVASVGHLRPGHYEVGFLLTWTQPVNDGFNDYGPGTSRPRDTGTCNFDVLPNPDGTSVVWTGMYFPSLFPVHNITPANQQ